MQTSKCILVTLAENGVIIEFVQRVTTFIDDDPSKNFSDSIVESYGVRVFRTKPDGPLDKVSIHGDIDGDNDVDEYDKRALIDLATAALKVPPPQ